MLSPKESSKVLLKMFRKKYVVTMDELFSALETQSRMSVFRRLKKLGYLTSFTDAGRYYTILDIPEFDKFGLWFYQDVGFSRAGTLKSTVIDIVDCSKAGMTPAEMLHLLRLKAPNSLHNTLHGLVKGNHIQRHRLEGLSLYTSIDSDTAQKQIAVRHDKIDRGSQVATAPSIEMIIAVLVEALRAGKVLPSASIVSARLSARGMIITVDQVKQIFSQYGLEAEKKMVEQP
jgi:hypothetical protein